MDRRARVDRRGAGERGQEVQRSLGSFAELRKVDVGYDVAPALAFVPVPPRRPPAVRRNQARPAETADLGGPTRTRLWRFCR